MTTEKVNKLLANAISTYAPQFGRALTKRVALKLATASVEDRLENISGDIYALAKAAFSNCGTILEENIADRTISGVILSGAANMNPAFVLLWIEHNNIYMKAAAKEGLIKQHAAEQAVKIFKLSFATVEGKQER